MDTSDSPILRLFLEISKVPRPSHHEERICAWLLEWGRAHGFACRRDAVGNVAMEVPATEGLESRPRVVLQAHCDMVAIGAPGVPYNPLNDPIDVDSDGTSFFSRGHRTTLGADDGMGIALALCAATEGIPHGPLRLLFTVDEEDGMAGAFGMEPQFLADAAALVNLDSESEGNIVISCAASVNFTFTGPGAATAPTLSTPLRLSVAGLTGGHSGCEIHCGRLNAMLALGGLLSLVREAGIPFELASLRGGDKRNAIPVAAEAMLLVAPADIRRIQTLALDAQVAFRAHFAPGTTCPTDPEAMVTAEVAAEAPLKAFSAEQARALLDFLACVPDGIFSMSGIIPGLVETSCNLGVFVADGSGFKAVSMSRGSDEARLAALGERLQAAGSLFKVDALRDGEAWPAEPDSRLVAVAKEAYRARLGGELGVRAIHAGLECGAFVKRNPRLECISMGVSIDGPHTVRERCDFASVAHAWEFLKGILELY